MLSAAVLWSFFPVIVEISDAASNPFAFAIIIGFLHSIGISIFLIIFYRDFLTKNNFAHFKNMIRKDRNTIITEREKLNFGKIWNEHPYWFTLVGRLTTLFYALATRHVDTAIAAMIYESWVIWFVFLRNYDGRNTSEPNKSLRMGKQAYAFLILALLGIYFISYSRVGMLDNTLNIGILFALAASFCDALSVERSHKFGEMSQNQIAILGQNQSKFTLVFTLFAYITTTLIASSILSVLFISIPSFNTGNSLDSSIFYVMIPYSLIIVSLVAIQRRKSNISTRSLEINSIPYITPVLALIWLLLFTRLGQANTSIARLDLFLIGTSIIISVSLLTNIRSNEQRQQFGNAWLAMSIWIAGMVIFLRDPILDTWLNDNWLWSGRTDYFALLGLSATMFVLLLSFRRSGLTELSRKEENLAYSIFWKIGKLMKYSTIELRKFVRIYEERGGNLLSPSETEFDCNIKPKDALVLSSLLEVDMASPSDSLTKNKQIIEDNIDAFDNDINTMKKSELLAELDSLIRSKSVGRETSERLVLIAFAMMTIFLTIATRPSFLSWNGFVIDIFSVLFAATIAFLIINQFDLRRERHISIFSSERYLQSPWSTIWIPIIICACQLAIFVILFYGKWLSDWGWATEVAPTVRLAECLSICPPS